MDKKVFHTWTQINEMKPQRHVVPAVWEGIYLYLKLEIQRERETRKERETRIGEWSVKQELL